MLILAFDPGQAESGVVLVDSAHLEEQPECGVIAAAVVKRGRGESDARYEARVVDQGREYARGLSARVAVETLTRPKKYLDGNAVKLIDPMSVVHTAMVLGAIRVAAHLGAFGDCGPVLEVAPNKNDGGSDPPQILVSEREGPALAGQNRHARSAWSVGASAAASLEAAGTER